MVAALQDNPVWICLDSMVNCISAIWGLTSSISGNQIRGSCAASPCMMDMVAPIIALR